MSWPHFSEDELRCHCGCGSVAMDPGFMDALERLRVEFGKPMIVTSGYRCQSHNYAVGGASNSGHMYGKAVDIAPKSQGDAWKLVELFQRFGFRGCGLRLHGPYGAWIVHLDTMPRDAIWTYA